MEQAFEQGAAPLTPNTPLTQPRKGITGSTLKLIALAIMLIDHIGAVVMEPLLISMSLQITDAAALSQEFIAQYNAIFMADLVLRYIGRIAFPLFCFLLVEGFCHTHDVKKYALRLAAFAFVSEIPFDLAVSGKVLEFGHQNVFFTLLLGLLAIWGIRALGERLSTWPIACRVVVQALSVIAAIAAAIGLRTDYSGFGVAAIVAIYLLRRHRVLAVAVACVILCVSTLMEITAFFALIPIALYNGQRGLKLKYVFYVFYPAHMLLLAGIFWMVQSMMGLPVIANLAAIAVWIFS